MVKDYDVFYFDESDLSWEAEDAVIQRVKAHFSTLDVPIEVKNQARVHLWYEQCFGIPCPALSSATHGIDRYLVSCARVGVEVKTGQLVFFDERGIYAHIPRHDANKVAEVRSVMKIVRLRH